VFVGALFRSFQQPNRVHDKIVREEGTKNKEKRKDAPHFQMRNGESVWTEKSGSDESVDVDVCHGLRSTEQRFLKTYKYKAR